MKNGLGDLNLIILYSSTIPLLQSIRTIYYDYSTIDYKGVHIRGCVEIDEWAHPKIILKIIRINIRAQKYNSIILLNSVTMGLKSSAGDLN